MASCATRPCAATAPCATRSCTASCAANGPRSNRTCTTSCKGADVLIDFFFTLKDAKIPVTIKEFLTLLEAMQQNVIGASMDDFYYVSRLTLVKDEAHFDKFDRAFAQYFKGINAAFETSAGIPLDWLIKRMERELSAEQKAQL